MGMLTLHHLEHSRSHRILWLLEELGVDYQIKRYERDPQTLLAPESLRRVHPLGKSPVISVDGEVVAESAVIIEYLLDRYGEGVLRPPVGSEEYERYRYWLHYAEASLMPPLLLSLVFTRLPTQVPWPMRPLVKGVSDRVRSTYVGPQIRTHLDYVEAQLAKDGWFAGPQFTAADIQMSYPLMAASRRASLEDRPHIAQWLEAVQKRAAFQRAEAKGGPAMLDL